MHWFGLEFDLIYFYLHLFHVLIQEILNPYYVFFGSEDASINKND